MGHAAQGLQFFGKLIFNVNPLEFDLAVAELTDHGLLYVWGVEEWEDKGSTSLTHRW